MKLVCREVVLCVVSVAAALPACKSRSFQSGVKSDGDVPLAKLETAECEANQDQLTVDLSPAEPFAACQKGPEGKPVQVLIVSSEGNAFGFMVAGQNPKNEYIKGTRVWADRAEVDGFVNDNKELVWAELPLSRYEVGKGGYCKGRVRFSTSEGTREGGQIEPNSFVFELQDKGQKSFSPYRTATGCKFSNLNLVKNLVSPEPQN